MNWFWHALWICLVVIPVTVLWIVSVFDLVFRRRDLAGWKRLLWLIVVLFFPLIGALLYIGIGARPAEGSDVRGELAYHDLESLHASGALDEREYARARDLSIRAWV